MFNDFVSFLRSDETPRAYAGSNEPAATRPTQAMPARAQRHDMERCFARLFSTDDGRRVLSYLQAMTFQRALGPTCADQELRYTEGQRALMASILRLIDRGRGG